MPRAKRTFTREYKLDAIQMAEAGDRTIAEVERDLGLHQGQIYHWKEQFAAAGVDAFPGKGHLPPQEERVRQLEREIEILRQERDILKKAINIFAQSANRP
jgi:transposase